MRPEPQAWDIEGLVQAEVFVVWLHGQRIELTGPCGAAPWPLELGPADHPVEVVDRVVRDQLGEPLLVHSTSWRRDREAVILTFVVAIGAELVAGMESLPVEHVELARSEATAAPRALAHGRVLEHALRHPAWLSSDDPVVSAILSTDWKAALSRDTPEPFGALG